jgi:tetratricopeptide (TPR) repeat protein
LEKALEAFQKKNYPLALVLFEELIRKEPEEPGHLYHFALSCFHTGNFKKCVRILEDLLERFPRFIELDRVYKVIIYSRIQLKEWDQAKRLIETRLGIHPNDPSLQSMLAHIYEKNHDLDKAIQIHREILAKHPGFKTSLNNLAVLLISRETASPQEIQEALEYIRDLLKIDPDNPVYLDSFGTVLEKLGNHASAKKALEKALLLAPQKTEILNHLTRLVNHS